MLNPIVDWLDEDVWEFIHAENIPYCELYDCGFKRIGCIGCPMNTHTLEEFARYPKYKENYIRAFDRMIATRRERGLLMPNNCSSGEAVMDWWINPTRREKDDENQTTIFDETE